MHDTYVWWESRRGPFRFVTTRATESTSSGSGWLPGEVDRLDVDEEARALLDDPRDTIVALHVWSVPEQQFVHTYRRRQR